MNFPADADHLGPPLEETRTLSLAESEVLQLHREPTDLGVLIGEVIADSPPLRASAGSN